MRIPILVAVALLALEAGAEQRSSTIRWSYGNSGSSMVQATPQTNPTTSDSTSSSPHGEVSYQSLPGLAVGRLVSDEFGVTCTAFLTGIDIVTTAAHCLATGVGNLKFRLHNRGDTFTAEARLTIVYTTGGGVGEDEGMDGTDWAHVRIDKPLGRQYGFLKLAEVSEIVGLPITVVGFGAKWHNGKYAGYSNCKVTTPPNQHKKYCKELENGEYLCNFFSHSCWVDPQGGGSGGPVTSLIDGTPQVVGIQLGASRLGIRAFNPAITVNETEPEAANVHFHWFNMRLFTGIDRLVERLGGYPFDTVPNQKHELVEEMRSLVSDWGGLTVDARFRRIQSWNTFEAQKAAISVLDQFSAGAPWHREWVATVDTTKLPDVIRRPDLQYGRFYISGNVSPLAPKSYPNLGKLTRYALEAEQAEIDRLLSGTQFKQYRDRFAATVERERRAEEQRIREQRYAAERSEQQRRAIIAAAEARRLQQELAQTRSELQRLIAARQAVRPTQDTITYSVPVQPTQQGTITYAVPVQPTIQYYSVPVVPVYPVYPVYGGSTYQPGGTVLFMVR